MDIRIRGTAALHREQARRGDGKFGRQEYARAEGVDLAEDDWMVPVDTDAPDRAVEAETPELVDLPEADTTLLGDNVTLGEGAVYGAEATVGDNSTLGDHSIIGEGVTIGRDVTIGENVRIGDGVTITDGCTVDNDTSLEDGVVIEDAHVEAGTSIGALTEIRNCDIGHGCSIGNDCQITGGDDAAVVGADTTLGAFTQVKDSTIGQDSTIDAHTRLTGSDLMQRVTVGGTLEGVSAGPDSILRAGRLEGLRIGSKVTMEAASDSRIRGESAYPEGGLHVGDGATLRAFRAETAAIEIGENVSIDGAGHEVVLTGGVVVKDGAEVQGDVQLGDREDMLVDDTHPDEPLPESTGCVCVEKGARIIGGGQGEKASLFDMGESYRTVVRGGGTVIGARTEVARGVHIDRGVEVGEESHLAARTQVGEGSFLGGGTVTLYDVQIGPSVELEEGVEVGEQVRVGGDTIVDEGARIADRAEVGVRARIGRMAMIARGARVDDFAVLQPYETVDR